MCLAPPSLPKRIGLDLSVRGCELEMTQGLACDTDFKRLPIGLIVDHIDERNDLAHGVSEVHASSSRHIHGSLLQSLP